ncbi:hypothetical protein PACILC2_21170 [Paenibacillus cisolokensis]|uniref:Tail fiber domain-containing protein n=1 Tax=Paenibacillus cisolokensis TaxID=1658519 RepID=A0ABQ4N5Q9_9BACL|nr:hypothetical protein [Paenibacillus cisolokensis]GIQ63549.1 hypothetical protein PACILC2_21170 [Paenibacillus cisolokensis]
MTNLNALITQNYRLTADDRNYTLLRRHIVDPAKAPGYKPQDGAAPPPIREEWRDDGYYPLNARGLAAAVERAVICDVNSGGNYETIAELVAAYQREVERVRTLISDALNAGN